MYNSIRATVCSAEAKEETKPQWNPIGTPADEKKTEIQDNPDASGQQAHNREACCSICFLPLEHGERVGVLPSCDHIFHVDCRKVRLTKRNVCPLCLSEDIAKPRLLIDDRTPSSGTRTSNGRTELIEGRDERRLGGCQRCVAIKLISLRFVY